MGRIRTKHFGHGGCHVAIPATLDTFNTKASYVFRGTYGASLAYANVRGSADATAYADSALNEPDTEAWTPELFWTPRQDLRVGLQRTLFTKYLGASSNYDGAGRNASDNARPLSTFGC